VCASVVRVCASAREYKCVCGLASMYCRWVGVLCVVCATRRTLAHTHTHADTLRKHTPPPCAHARHARRCVRTRLFTVRFARDGSLCVLAGRFRVSIMSCCGVVESNTRSSNSTSRRTTSSRRSHEAP
jgi:hypothetical protein